MGVSTHDREQLEAAILAGAGYLGVGPVFPSATKEFSEPELAGLGYVRLAAETTSLPWFAIGGITEKNAGPRSGSGRHADRRERRGPALAEPSPSRRSIEGDCRRNGPDRRRS